jgi:hypothetical protein
MLLRCATGMMTRPVGIAAGLLFATGIATGVAVGAGLVGAAMVGKRMWEERQGWKSGAAGDAAPPGEPAADVPLT